MTTRRDFIKRTSIVSAGVGLLGNLAFAKASTEPDQAIESFEYVPTVGEKRITILHTNDTHSHIEPFPANDRRNPNGGGVARRATLVQKIRKENPNTLLLDAGDIFQGTPYFNFYGGELEIKLMSMLGYDASTLGNHDFDNGIEGLHAQLPHATFPFVISNYDFRNTVMNGRTKQHIVLERDGVRVGIFGLGIQLDGLVTKKLYKETQYLDPIAVAQDQVKRLKQEQNCDLVVCLSHLGNAYRGGKVSDHMLAAATKDIDLIIGGHTHTFLAKPEQLTNAAGKPVLVNQVGAYGLYLGQVDFVSRSGVWDVDHRVYHI